MALCAAEPAPPPPHVQRHVIVNGKVTYMFTPPPCCGVCLSCVPPPPAAVQLYVIRNGEVSQTIIQLESPAVGLTRLNKDVMVRGVEGHRGDGGGVGKKGGRALSMRVQVGCVVRGKGAGGSLSPTIALSPPPPPLHMFQVGCMNNTVHCYRADGHKAFSLYMPDRVISMQV